MTPTSLVLIVPVGLIAGGGWSVVATVLLLVLLIGLCGLEFTEEAPDGRKRRLRIRRFTDRR